MSKNISVSFSNVEYSLLSHVADLNNFNTVGMMCKKMIIDNLLWHKCNSCPYTKEKEHV